MAFEPRIVPALTRIISIDTSTPDTSRDIRDIQTKAMGILARHFHELDDPHAVVVIALKWLRHPNSNQQHEAARALEKVPPEFDLQITGELLDRVETESDGGVMCTMCQTLRRLRGPRMAERLVTVLLRKPLFAAYFSRPRNKMPQAEIEAAEDNIRQTICLTLQVLGDDRAIPILRKRLHLREPIVIWTLGMLGDTESQPVFLDCLQSNDVARKNAGAQALAHTAGPDEFQAMRRTFLSELQNPAGNHDLIRTLAWGLTCSDEERAASVLVNSLRILRIATKRFDRDPRFGVLRSLGPATVPLLVREVAGEPTITIGPDGKFAQVHSTRFSRGASVALLAGMAKSHQLLNTDEPLVIGLLAQQLDSSEPPIRKLAAEALNKSQSQSGIDALLTLLESDKSTTDSFDSQSKAAARALSWIAATAPDISRIESLLSHNAPYVREAAAQAIVESGHPEAERLVLKLLHDGNAGVQAAAARLLCIAEEAVAADRLWSFLDGALPESDHRTGTHIPTGNPILLKQGWWQSSKLVSAVTQSLGVLSVFDSRDSLARLLTDDAIEIRAAAILGLVQIDDERGHARFRDVLNGYDRNLQRSLLSQTAALAQLASQGRGAHPLSHGDLT